MRIGKKHPPGGLGLSPIQRTGSNYINANKGVAGSQPRRKGLLDAAIMIRTMPVLVSGPRPGSRSPVLKDAQNALAEQPPDYLQAAIRLDAIGAAAQRAAIRAHKIHFGQE